ncbi:MAG: translation elongation factor-like protein [Chloroflexi bacterium]|nr:translation elongation factor-like protein [Chloroflexota bacterium]
MPEVDIGSVSDFFSRAMAAGIELTGNLHVGDKIHIKGHTTDMEFVVPSMQVDNKPVEDGKPGDAVGVRVPERVRRGDKVYRVS